jgi:hypothetical protein
MRVAAEKKLDLKGVLLIISTIFLGLRRPSGGF